MDPNSLIAANDSSGWIVLSKPGTSSILNDEFQHGAKVSVKSYHLRRSLCRMEGERIDLSRPRWSQDTFLGRLKHYASVTDPRVAFVPTWKLLDAKNLVESYKRREEPVGTTLAQLYRAQKLTQSAFHPDTGELQNVVGRMSFQVPGGTILIGAMLIWYKSTGAVFFWQWANQSFNALVNYTNRNAKSELTANQIGTAYVSATAAALVTSLGLKKYLATRAGALAQRFVPFCAVAAANCVNIPLMRQGELRKGVAVTNENDETIAQSKVAAVKGISLVTFCRVLIITPTMILIPIAMGRIEKAAFFARRPGFYNLVFQASMCAVMSGTMVPIGCSLFPQKNWIQGSTLAKWEPPAFEEVENYFKGDSDKARSATLYFNKGL